MAFLEEVLVEVRRHGQNSYATREQIQNALIESVLSFEADIPLTASQRKPLLLLAIGASVAVTAFLLPELPILGQLAAGAALMAIFFACVHAFILGHDARDVLRRMLTDPASAWSFMTQKS